MTIKQKRVIRLYKEWQKLSKKSEKAEEKYNIAFSELSDKELYDEKLQKGIDLE